MKKKRIGQLSRQLDGDKDRDCKNCQHGQRQIGRDFVKADTEIVNPVFHADALCNIRFLLNCMDVKMEPLQKFGFCNG